MPPEVAGGLILPSKDHGVFQAIARVQKNLVNRAQNFVDKFGWLANFFGWFAVDKSLCFFLGEIASWFQSIARTKKHGHMHPPPAKPIFSSSLLSFCPMGCRSGNLSSFAIAFSMPVYQRAATAGDRSTRKRNS
jgi:hypothetical protein